MIRVGINLQRHLIVLSIKLIMKYKVGDMISCNVEIFKNKKRKISVVEPKKDSEIEVMYFQIISIDEVAQSYKILIEPDMSGWDINKFHVKHQRVDDKLIGSKFYDVAESLIVEEKKKK